MHVYTHTHTHNKSTKIILFFLMKLQGSVYEEQCLDLVMIGANVVKRWAAVTRP